MSQPQDQSSPNGPWEDSKPSRSRVPPVDDSPAPPDAEGAGDEPILDSVVRETLKSLAARDAWELIQRVAARPGNTDVTQLATTEELVREILLARWGSGLVSGDLPRRVAEIMLEDVHVRARLIHLWAKVHEDGS